MMQLFVQRKEISMCRLRDVALTDFFDLDVIWGVLGGGGVINKHLRPSPVKADSMLLFHTD